MTADVPSARSPSADSSAVPEFVRRSWPADAHQLGSIREDVRRWITPLALTAQACDDIVFAVSEMVTNAIEHAYSAIDRTASSSGTVELTLWTEPDALCIEIVDHGTWQEPTTGAAGRGLGIPVVHRVVESVMIHYDPRGTRVLLRHGLPGEARPAPDPGAPPVAADLGDFTPRDTT